MNNWNNIPYELRLRPQWCIAGVTKEPLTLNGSGLTTAKVNEPSTWMTFEQAATIAYKHNLGIGYVLHEDDPYACIDFDIKDSQNAPNDKDKWTTREDMEFFNMTMGRFNSYTERSISGRGFHTWIKGRIGRGVRDRGVEIYSQERFIICTGDVTSLRPIENRDLDLVMFAQYLRTTHINGEYQLDDLEPEYDYWYLFEMAARADNAEKFTMLWEGRWQEMNYPSQSEADLALLSMLAFYSKSNRLVRETFRASELGKRNKARRNDDYLNLTLKTIRARQEIEEGADLNGISQSAELKAQIEQSRMIRSAIQAIEGVHNPIEIHPLQVPNQPLPEVILPVASSQIAAAYPVPQDVHEAGQEGIPWPPGLTGHLARFMYQSMYISVKEVAIASAIGLLAGICGKGWNIPKSGLNMYIILIAKSGIGKEGLSDSISTIIKACMEKTPIFANFFDFRDMASGPALTKACVVNSCFLNIVGEFGQKLRRMSEESTAGPMTTLRTEMTNLYQKSGPASIVGGIRYSQEDQNVQSVSGVSYSMIGESTPGTFYQALTENMMEDGFLSRFLCIEYTGQRDRANPNIILKPDDFLVETLVAMAHHTDRTVKSGQISMTLSRTEQTAAIIERFDEECRTNINQMEDESKRQMWSRASLKAQRMAGLMAVGDNFVKPIIEEQHITWAIDVVRRNIAIMQRRMEEGDVGTTDTSREQKVLSIITKYLEEPLTKAAKFNQAFKNNSVITYKYIQQHIGPNPSFKNFKGGSKPALEITIRGLMDSGYIQELDKNQTVKNYNFNGKAYRVLNLPKYEGD